MDFLGIQAPYKALTNFEIEELVKKLEIPNFIGCLMKNELSNNGPKDVESAIVNFETNEMTGSHWVAYRKVGSLKQYFDSYGGPILAEIRDYLGSQIYRSTVQVQDYNTPVCGHLCLYWLKSLSMGKTFENILADMSASSGGDIAWSSNLADELHKPLKINYKKRQVYVKKAFEIYGADLIDYSTISKQNSGFKWVLMIIDCFSRYGWAVSLKDKSGPEVLRGLKLVYEKTPSLRLWTDLGKEFYNKDVQSYLKSKGVVLYSTNNKEKCSIVERWNRTIKGKLGKYFTANMTHRYVDVLQDLIHLYNNTKHRSIKMTPSEASLAKNHDRVFRHLYENRMHQLGEEKSKFAPGQKVRVALELGAFDKKYGINWTDDVYTVKEVLKTRPLTYSLLDEHGHLLKGRYYNEDLQAVRTDLFRVNKILKRKTVRGKKMAYVSWMGSSQNSWEPAKNIQG